MKKVITLTILVSGLFAGGITFAQSSQVTFPSAGLTPESSFYFLDRLGENMRQFFTFNSEAKANLQIEFAGERIAEIKVMVEKKGANAKGLAIAESLLQANVAYAAEIVSKEKISGKDVAALAKKLNDEFDERDKLLEKTFKDAKDQLKTQRKEIKTNLLAEARRVGDTTQVAVLEAQLNDIDAQIDALGQKNDQLGNSLQSEQKNIEKEMSEADQKKEEIEQKEEQEAIEAEEAIEDTEADEPKEIEEPKEDIEQPEAENEQDKDNDKDSVPDIQDNDDDNDRELDVNEQGKTNDHDNDRIADVQDRDNDNDSISDTNDSKPSDHDNDGENDNADQND